MKKQDSALIMFVFDFWLSKEQRKQSFVNSVTFIVVNHHMETLKTGGIESGNYSVLSVDSKYNQLLVGAR